MDRAEAETIHDSGREACVEFILDLAGRFQRHEDRLKRLEEQGRQDSRTSSKPPSADPPKTRAERRAEARAKAKELMRREGERRKAGAQPGHRGAGRELRPEDQVDEIVDHYPDACGGCGRLFADGQRRAGGRFGRHPCCRREEGMMVVVAEAKSEDVVVDPPSVVVERLEAFGAAVLAEAINRPVQMVNGGLYLRGLLEQGPRKSLEPLVERLGGEGDYQSMQQFLAVSPWDPALVVKATAERVVPAIDVQAWVLDDTGFPKDGKNSPGVKRQYSGTLGKIGNCQIGVSLHAAGSKGTVPLGWALYLPEEWCEE
jgi:DDE superfamily endonuclease/Family of unknown function (DUF6444)